ncbi:unnamed protein product [Miscanthus lutarioriparius]|uniref:Uncharacterized protein n=1 Tax=Miscanthus lutarioriparius TaxID=422564 RepID=A0A811RYJ4_9POAL|nr:unnamed protein product [Miscanthus lutarioriparius]
MALLRGWRLAVDGVVLDLEKRKQILVLNLLSGLIVPIGATGGMAGKDPLEEWDDLMERLDFDLGDGVNSSLMCFMA